MTGPSGNSEFCFPEILNVPNDGQGPVIKCFVISSDLRIEKLQKKNDLIDALAYGDCARKTSGCQNRAVLSKQQEKSSSSQLTKT